MGVTINGAASSQSQGRMTGALEIKNSYARQAKMAQTTKTKTQTKRALNYNYRELSAQLMRTKKIQGAANVATRAKGKLASLQRCAGSGQYDAKEVSNAIAHARRMVRCAQMKVNHLKEEERELSKHTKSTSAEEQKKKNEIKRRVSQKEQQLEQKMKLEMLADVRAEKSRRQEMIRKRKSHRNQERAKINEADMKYIKAMTESGKNESSDYQPFDSGVFVQLSASAISLAEAEAAQKIQQELDAELALETSMDTSSGMSSDMGMVAGSQTGSMTAPTINVTL